MDFKVKDRSAKVAKRRAAMPVNGRSVFTIQHAIEKRASQPVKRGKR
jgi:hypothetical protein